jgi:hypothetical protein
MKATISMKVTDQLSFKTGITGNRYVYSLDRKKISEICEMIGKAKSSIYRSKKYKCYVIRVKARGQKKKLDRYKIAQANVSVSASRKLSRGTAKALEKMVLQVIDQSSQGLLNFNKCQK